MRERVKGSSRKLRGGLPPRRHQTIVASEVRAQGHSPSKGKIIASSGLFANVTSRCPVQLLARAICPKEARGLWVAWQAVTGKVVEVG